MSREIVQGQIDTKCLDQRFDSELNAVVSQPKFVTWMQDAGYPVEDLDQCDTNVSAKAGENNSGHFLYRVWTLNRPIDEADAVEDNYSFHACSCPGFHFHRFPALDEGERITSVGECEHLKQWRKRRRGERDDCQASLDEDDEETYGVHLGP